MPTGVGAGKAIICIYKVLDYPGLLLIFLSTGVSTVRYGKCMVMANPIYIG